MRDSREERLGDSPAIRGGVPSPPTRVTPDSPVRERGAPSRSGASLCEGPPASLPWRWGRCGETKENQVACSRTWRARSRIRATPKPTNLEWDEDDIQSFWGQLWYIPKSILPQSRARVRVKEGEHLVWIKKDLWSAKSFNPTDCYSVGEGDYWSEAPSKVVLRGGVLG